MADISRITIPDGTAYDIKDASAVTSITIAEGVMTITYRDGTYTTQSLSSAAESYLYAGSGTGANATTTNGNTHLTLTNGGTVASNLSLVGSGGVSVTSNSSGTVTLAWADSFEEVSEANIETIIAGGTVSYGDASGDDSFEEVIEDDITAMFTTT